MGHRPKGFQVARMCQNEHYSGRLRISKFKGRFLRVSSSGLRSGRNPKHVAVSPYLKAGIVQGIRIGLGSQVYIYTKQFKSM